MWKAAFTGRSDRDREGERDRDRERDNEKADTASNTGHRRRHRSGSDVASVVSSAPRRTDSDRKKRHHHDRSDEHRSSTTERTGPSQLRESALRALDNEDEWEDDDADAKSERRSKRSSKSRTEEDDDHKRRERQRAKDRETERQREKEKERERERDRDRKRKPSESKSTPDKSRGKSRVEELVDEPGRDRAVPAMGSFEQFPGMYDAALVRPPRDDEPTMSGALPYDPHVTSQFPGQNPVSYAKPDFQPNPHGEAADYYGDQGQSVDHQPGIRPSTPMMLSNPDTHLVTPFATSNPAADTGNGAAADFYSGKLSPVSAQNTPLSSSKPLGSGQTKPGKRPSATSSATAIAATAAAIGGLAGTQSSQQHSSSSTSYQQSTTSNGVQQSSSRPSVPFKPSRHNSDPAFMPGGGVYGAPPAITGKPGKHSSQTDHAGLYAAAGAAALGATAYGISHHNSGSTNGASQYNGGGFGDARPSYRPDQPGSYYGRPTTGVQHYHEHKGPMTRLKDGFLNLLSDPDDVRKMEEYTEYIGVCKHCFDPRSTPADGPRTHHYHPRKRDSFESLRRRTSNERLRRKASGERIGAYSRIQKESRYAASDAGRKQKGMSKSEMAGLGLLGAGAATAGAALWNGGKDFDDTYSVKSGHRASSARRTRSRSSSRERRRRTTHGIIGPDREEKEKWVTVRTRDGRVEKRKVLARSRSRSREVSRDRKSSWTGAASGAVLGAAALTAAGAASSRHHGHDREDKVFVRRKGHARSRSRSSSSDRSTEKRSRRSGRRSPTASYYENTRRGSRPTDEGFLGGFFAEPKKREKQHGKKKKERGFFSFASGSPSSSDSELAFGDGLAGRSSLGRVPSTSSKISKRKVNRRNSDERLAAAVAGIGATTAALAAAQRGNRITKRGSRPELGARRETREFVQGGHQGADVETGEWEDELPSDVDDASSVDSGLAFGGDDRRRRLSRQSVDSLASNSSAGGLGAWGWRWGSKKKKGSQKQPRRRPSDFDFDAHAGAVEASQNHGLGGSQQPMQYIDPRPLSEHGSVPGSRHASMPGAFPSTSRPGPGPIQQPQPIAPIPPNFTTSVVEEPLRPTASSSQRDNGSFIQDAALISGAALATAGIIASQGGRRSSGSVRFGLTEEQQSKEREARRYEREREEEERRRVDRAKALKEEARRAALEEDKQSAREKERKAREARDDEQRRAREARDREFAAIASKAEEERRRVAAKRESDEQAERLRQQQRESKEREEAYRREQARVAEEADRRAQEQRDADRKTRRQQEADRRQQEEHRRFVDEEERERRKKEQQREAEEQERFDRERDEGRMSKRKGSRKEEQISREGESAWKAPVAAGVAGALVGAVLEGAAYKDARSDHRNEERSKDGREQFPAFDSYQTIEPTNEHSGEPITDDALFDPDFFKRRRSQSELNREASMTQQEAENFVAEREAYYNSPAPTAAEIFAPKELLDRSAQGKERSTDPDGGNAIQVYHDPSEQIREHFEHPIYNQDHHDIWRPGPGTFARQRVPTLNVIAPTPPPGASPLLKGKKDTKIPRTVEVQGKETKDGDKRSERRQSSGRAVTWGEDQTHIYQVQTPEPTADRHSYVDNHHPSASHYDEIVVEESEPNGNARTTRYGKDDIARARQASVERRAEKESDRQRESASETSRGKGGKSWSSDSAEFSYSQPSYESVSGFGFPGASPSNEVDPPVHGWVEDEEVDDPTPSEEKSVKMPGGFDSADYTSQSRSTEDRAKPSKDNERRKDEAPKSAKSDTPRVSSVVAAALAAATGIGATADTTEGAARDTPAANDEDAWEPPLSKKDKKKREKAAKRASVTQEDAFQGSEDKAPEAVPEPVTAPKRIPAEPEKFADEEEPVVYLSKKERKRRDKAAQRGDFADDIPDTSREVIEDEPIIRKPEPVEEPTEEPEEVFLTKKEKKRREKAAQRAELVEDVEDEPIARKPEPVEEPTQEPEEFFLSKKEKKKREKAAQRVDLAEDIPESPRQVAEDEPVIRKPTQFQEPEEEPEDAFLSKKEKKKREKAAKRVSLAEETPERFRDDPVDQIVTKTAQEPIDEPEEMFLSKKDKKKRQKAAKRGVSFEGDSGASTPNYERESTDFDRDIGSEGVPKESTRAEDKPADKASRKTGFGSLVESVMTTGGIAALAGAAKETEQSDSTPQEDDLWATSSKKDKKSKKKKKLGEPLDRDIRDIEPPISDTPVLPAYEATESTQDKRSSMPGGWDEEENAREGNTTSESDSKAREGGADVQDANGEDEWADFSSKKSKKKQKKRESGLNNEPAVSSPLRSQVEEDEPTSGRRAVGWADEVREEDASYVNGHGKDQGRTKYETTADDRYDQYGTREPAESTSERKPVQKDSNRFEDEPRQAFNVGEDRSESTRPTEGRSRRDDYHDADDAYPYDDRSVAGSSASHSRRRKSRHQDDDTSSVISSRSRRESDNAASSTKDKKGGILGSLFGRKSSEPEPLSRTSTRESRSSAEGDVSRESRHHKRRTTGSENGDDQESRTSRHRENGDEDSRERHRHRRHDDDDDYEQSRDHHRRRSDGLEKTDSRDSRDRSFLGMRVEDLPPLPASTPASPVSELEKHEQGFGIPVSAGTTDAEKVKQTASRGDDSKLGESERYSLRDTPGHAQEYPPLPDSEPGSPTAYVENQHRPGFPTRIVSSTAVPLRFRPPPYSPKAHHTRSLSLDSPVEASSPISPASANRPKANRLRSSDVQSGEFKPLYLAERYSKPIEDIDEGLPSLPSSKPSSRASSVVGSEAYHSASEEPQWSSPSGTPLRIDTSAVYERRSSEDVLGSQQTTPKASDFSHADANKLQKQQPQFYTWEDLMREQYVDPQHATDATHEQRTPSGHFNTPLPLDAKNLPALPPSRPSSPNADQGDDRSHRGHVATAGITATTAAVLGGAAAYLTGETKQPQQGESAELDDQKRTNEPSQRLHQDSPSDDVSTAVERRLDANKSQHRSDVQPGSLEPQTKEYTWPEASQVPLPSDTRDDNLQEPISKNLGRGNARAPIDSDALESVPVTQEKEESDFDYRPALSRKASKKAAKKAKKDLSSAITAEAEPPTGASPAIASALEQTRSSEREPVQAQEPMLTASTGTLPDQSTATSVPEDEWAFAGSQKSKKKGKKGKKAAKQETIEETPSVSAREQTPDTVATLQTREADDSLDAERQLENDNWAVSGEKSVPHQRPSFAESERSDVNKAIEQVPDTDTLPRKDALQSSKIEEQPSRADVDSFIDQEEQLEEGSARRLSFALPPQTQPSITSATEKQPDRANLEGFIDQEEQLEEGHARRLSFEATPQTQPSKSSMIGEKTRAEIDDFVHQEEEVEEGTARKMAIEPPPHTHASKSSAPKDKTDRAEIDDFLHGEEQIEAGTARNTVGPPPQRQALKSRTTEEDTAQPDISDFIHDEEQLEDGVARATIEPPPHSHAVEGQTARTDVGHFIREEQRLEEGTGRESYPISGAVGVERDDIEPPALRQSDARDDQDSRELQSAHPGAPGVEDDPFLPTLTRKQSKKAKKKAKAAFLWDEGTPETPNLRQETAQPAPEAATREDATQDDFESVKPSSSAIPKEPVEPIEPFAETEAPPTKKGKKGKKKRQSAFEMWEEPDAQPSLTETIEADKSLGAGVTNDAVLSNEPVPSNFIPDKRMQAVEKTEELPHTREQHDHSALQDTKALDQPPVVEAQQDNTDEFWSIPVKSKKSKKGKKNQTEQASAVATPSNDKDLETQASFNQYSAPRTPAEEDSSYFPSSEVPGRVPSSAVDTQDSGDVDNDGSTFVKGKKSKKSKKSKFDEAYELEASSEEKVNPIDFQSASKTNEEQGTRALATADTAFASNDNVGPTLSNVENLQDLDKADIDWTTPAKSKKSKKGKKDKSGSKTAAYTLPAFESDDRFVQAEPTLPSAPGDVDIDIAKFTPLPDAKEDEIDVPEARIRHSETDVEEGHGGQTNVGRQLNDPAKASWDPDTLPPLPDSPHLEPTEPNLSRDVEREADLTSAPTNTSMPRTVSGDAFEAKETQEPHIETTEKIDPEMQNDDSFYTIKKSKKDKKKAKKAKAEEYEPQIAQPEITEAREADLLAEEAVVASVAAAAVIAADNEKREQDLWEETPKKHSKKEKRKAKKSGISTPLAQAESDFAQLRPESHKIPAEDASATRDVNMLDVADIGHEAPSSSRNVIQDSPSEKHERDPENIPLPKDDIEDLREPNPTSPSLTTTQPTRSREIDAHVAYRHQDLDDGQGMATTTPTAGQDIDFAATLAAGLAGSGFDPNLVVEDSSFHRRASPPGTVAEADPEEFMFTAPKKKKKGNKGKQAQQEPEDEKVTEKTGPATAVDDFDAALSRGLQESGFNADLLDSAKASNQDVSSQGVLDEPEEFTIAKPKRKKGKKDKQITEDVELSERVREATPPVSTIPGAWGSSSGTREAAKPEDPGQERATTSAETFQGAKFVPVEPSPSMSKNTEDVPALEPPLSSTKLLSAADQQAKENEGGNVAGVATVSSSRSPSTNPTTEDDFTEPASRAETDSAIDPSPHEGAAGLLGGHGEMSVEEMDKAYRAYKRNKRKMKKEKAAAETAAVVATAATATAAAVAAHKTDQDASDTKATERNLDDAVPEPNVKDVNQTDRKPALYGTIEDTYDHRDVPSSQRNVTDDRSEHIQQQAEDPHRHNTPDREVTPVSPTSPTSATSMVQSVFPGLQRVKRRTASIDQTKSSHRRGSSIGSSEAGVVTHTSEASQYLPTTVEKSPRPSERKTADDNYPPVHGAAEDRAHTDHTPALAMLGAAAAATGVALASHEKHGEGHVTGIEKNRSGKMPLESDRSAPTEPTWSFSALQDEQHDRPKAPLLPDKSERDVGGHKAISPPRKTRAASDASRGLPEIRTTASRESLSSRRSLDPLHVDIDGASDWKMNVSKHRAADDDEAQLSAPRSRTPSNETPLEPTSRNRASYLFQSTPETTPEMKGSKRLSGPRHDKETSDYFRSPATGESQQTPSGRTRSAAFSPPPGPLSPQNPLDTIPEENANKRSLTGPPIEGPERQRKALRRTETPQIFRDQAMALGVTDRDQTRSVSEPMHLDDISRHFPSSGVDAKTLARLESDSKTTPSRRVPSDFRSPSVLSNRSNASAGLHRTPEDLRSYSRVSNGSGSGTPVLRRISMSGDLRAASRASNRRGDAGSGVGARASPITIPFEPPPTPPLNDEDVIDTGASRAADMADVFQGYGDSQGSHMSPTRPPSIRKRQSMHIMELESRLDQLAEENRSLQDAQQSRGSQYDSNGQSLRSAIEAREIELRQKDAEIHRIRAMLEPMHDEVSRLTEINLGLTEANKNLVDDTNGRYATLQAEHAHAHDQWQTTSRELDDVRQQHSQLTSGMKDAIAAQLTSALQDKDLEIRRLREQLDVAGEQIRALQVDIQSSKTSDFLLQRSEDYLDGACQKLCQHVQQWVLRFSKSSDNRACRLSSELNDDKIETRLDNAILDGSDVDKLLGDRVKRRDVFMSVVTTMIWEYVFTRYLFGMDREQRQKLKALEKTLAEVGPARAVAHWRATTLTLLSQRPTFADQCAMDTEAVAHEVFGVLCALLPPPSNVEQQLVTSLQRVIKVAVDLSIEMRTQRAEYIMLPPLQPEYDTEGELVRKMHFNASLMNERSGLYNSNEELEAERAVVKLVLFPPVVKKGDDFGDGAEEIVVCPAQVLVHNDNGRGKKVVRVMSGAMEIDDPRMSRQSLISTAPGASAM